MAPRPKPAALHATAPVGEPPPFHQDRGLPLPAFGDPPIESRTPLRAHATFDVMPDRAVLFVHPDQFAHSGWFVPAEATGYITRS